MIYAYCNYEYIITQYISKYLIKIKITRRVRIHERGGGEVGRGRQIKTSGLL